jgi:hypothetical protein
MVEFFCDLAKFVIEMKILILNGRLKLALCLIIIDNVIIML